MDPEPSLELLGLTLSLLVLTFAASAEAALTAITRHRVNAMLADGEPRARALMELFENPSRLRGTILVLSTIATVAATALTLGLAQGLTAGGQVGVLAGLVLAILVLGMALPKAVAARRPDTTALLLARPLRLASLLCWPLLTLLRLLVRPGDAGNPMVSEEELRLLANMGEEEGMIEADEREMIRGIFEFSDTVVREVMVPRIDIAALSAHLTVWEAFQQLHKARHSRAPVYDDSIDQIVGVINIKDLMGPLSENRGGDRIRPLLRSPFFVPESMKVDDLLRAMQQRRVRMAIIVDEYGGTAGLATIEDLVEEIVGEIQDEYDLEEVMSEQVAQGEWRFDGRISLYEVNELTGLSLASDEVDSLGGYVSEHLGSIPQEGDMVELGGATLTVASVKGLRPQMLRLVVASPAGIPASNGVESETRIEG